MKWFQRKVGGRRITVHLVSAKHPKLEGCDGMYHSDLCAIYIDKALQHSKRLQITTHELLEHAVDDISGAGHIMKAAVRDESRFEEVEEARVRARTPIVYELFQDFGACFPPVPLPRQRKALS